MVELQQNKKNYLLLFDIDCTVSSSNHCFHLLDLLPQKPEEVINFLLNPENGISQWIDQNNYIYKQYKKHNISIEDLQKKDNTLPLTNNFPELFEFIRKVRKNQSEYNCNIDVVFITGAQELICKWLIEYHKLDDIVDEVITYKNSIEDGLITMLKYHDHNCDTCMAGLCKNQGIHELIEIMKNKKDASYDAIFFFGDGDNDYCAGKALSNIKLNDPNILFARKGYFLFDHLFDKDLNPTEHHKKLSCKIQGFNDGNDILNYLYEVLPKNN